MQSLQQPLASLQQDFQEPFLQLTFQRQHGGPHSINCMCIQWGTSLSSVQPENNIYDNKIKSKAIAKMRT